MVAIAGSENDCRVHMMQLASCVTILYHEFRGVKCVCIDVRHKCIQVRTGHMSTPGFFFGRGRFSKFDRQKKGLVRPLMYYRQHQPLLNQQFQILTITNVQTNRITLVLTHNLKEIKSKNHNQSYTYKAAHIKFYQIENLLRIFKFSVQINFIQIESN